MFNTSLNSRKNGKGSLVSRPNYQDTQNTDLLAPWTEWRVAPLLFAVLLYFIGGHNFQYYLLISFRVLFKKLPKGLFETVFMVRPLNADSSARTNWPIDLISKGTYSQTDPLWFIGV